MKLYKTSDFKSLSQLIYKSIIINTEDGRTIEGEAVSFDNFIESPTGYEMIGIQKDGYIDCVDESEIKTIEIIE